MKSRAGTFYDPIRDRPISALRAWLTFAALFLGWLVLGAVLAGAWLLSR